MPTTLKINRRQHTVDVPKGTPLLWVLRDHLNMTGTKFGCGISQCGACTVHVDGRPIRSCSVPHESVAGNEITTIEGKEGTTADAVREAWRSLDVPQCGYCQSGQILAAIALLETKKKPSDADIDDAMRGNICRCITYVTIRRAIKQAAESL